MVEAIEELAERPFVPAAAEGFGEVVVGVDDGKAGLVDGRLFDYEFRSRPEFRKGRKVKVEPFVGFHVCHLVPH